MSSSPRPDVPIACSLGPESQATRQQEIDRLFQHVQATEEIEDGYVYQFSGDQGIVEELTRFVLLERECCPFFTFELVFDPEQGPVTLRMRGPEGTKTFLESNW